MGYADLATVTQHLRRIYWWLLVGKTLPEHQFGSMFADSGHGGNLAAHLPDHVCGFAFEAATRWLRLAWAGLERGDDRVIAAGVVCCVGSRVRGRPGGRAAAQCGDI